MEFVFILLYFVLWGAVSLATYLLQSFGLNKMGKSLNIKNSWLAFIPFANIFAFGRIAEKYVKFNGKNSAKFSKILLILSIIIAVLSIAISTFAIAVIVMVNFYKFGNSNDIMALSGFLFTLLATEIIMIAAAIVYMVIYYVALWRIFAIFDYNNATLYLVLSIFISIVCPIFIFALRNKEPKIYPHERMNCVQLPAAQDAEDVNNIQE